MDWHRILPQAGAFTADEMDRAWEVRLRCGQPVQLVGPDGIKTVGPALQGEQLNLALLALCGHSLAHREAAIAQGFLPLPGGHRLGICGERSGHRLLALGSLCVRIAHQVKGCALPLFPRLYRQNVLVLGPPGSGKTTLLRDIVRITAQDTQVALHDARGEIAAAFQGLPQLDVGPLCDVMTGGRKDEIMLQMLRSMNPQIIATDELGTAEDAHAVMEISRCGVGIIATAHARSPEDIQGRPSLAPLMENRIFTYAVLLDSPQTAPRILPL